jgi:hypothetical protein
MYRLGSARQQRAGHGQLLGRAGGRKAHRHRIAAAAAAVPALDEVDAVALGLRHVVAQAVGRVAVHQHLAGDERMPRCRGGGEQRLGRGLVHRGEHHRRGGAVGQQRVEEALGAGGGHRRVGIGALGREGVGVEPVEQLGAVAGHHRRAAGCARGCR